MQPGETITPRDNLDTKPEESVSPAQDSSQMQPQNAPAPDVNTSANTPNDSSPQSEEPSPWQYNQDDTAGQNQFSPIDMKPVNWSASEFIDHEKNPAWFMGLAGFTIISVGVIFLITRDYVTAVVIIISAVFFGVIAKRKPRTLQYQIDNIGLVIDGKPFPYDVFKSFTVFAEGAFNSIQLMPLKRFMPPLSLYFPPENEEQIISTLGSFLPHDNKTRDPIDRLMRRVRF